MKELKPCPFCGGKAVFRFNTTKQTATAESFACSYQIRCSKCGTTTNKSNFEVLVVIDPNEETGAHINANSREEAVEAWNRRADDDK